MTYQELIDKAVLQAKIGLDPQSISTRNEMVANSLIAQVFQDVALGYAGNIRSLPRLIKTVTFTNGAGTLSDDVLTGTMMDAELYDSADPTKVYSFVPEWDDFIRVYDTRIGYFTIRGGTNIYVIEPGSLYQEGVGLTGSRKLVVSGVPAIPTSATAAIVAPQEFVTAALNLLVARLRGGATA